MDAALYYRPVDLQLWQGDILERAAQPYIKDFPGPIRKTTAAGKRTFYDKRMRMALCWLDPPAGKLTACLALPSGGDTSYAGLVWHEGLL